MTIAEVRELVAEVLCLRNMKAYRDEEDELIASGTVLASQVGRQRLRERAAHLRAIAPGPVLLQTDPLSKGGLSRTGSEVPPKMALRGR